jgi:hypothetical protein
VTDHPEHLTPEKGEERGSVESTTISVRRAAMADVYPFSVGADRSFVTLGVPILGAGHQP